MMIGLIFTLLLAQVDTAPPSVAVPAVTAVPSVSPSPAASEVPSASPSASGEPSASPAASVPSTVPSPAQSLLLVSPSNVDLNPAQQATVTVSNARGALQASLDHALVAVAIDPSTNVITLTARQSTGNDVLHILDESGAHADVPIRVMFNAGTIPKTALLKVTGSPVDPAWLAAQVATLVLRLSLPAPGAQTVVAPLQTPLVAPSPGSQTDVSVPVQIAGNGLYFDQNGATTVTVQNVPLGGFLPGVLWYDDDPERISADGVLYRGTVNAAQPIRLYYYHDDGAAPRRVVIAFSSQSQQPTSLQVIDASAGPNIDVMSVGHAVTKDYLLMKPHNEGLILDLNGAEPYALHDLAVTPKQGVAGNVDVRVLSGGPVTVTVLAVSPGVNPAVLMGGPLLPDDGHHRTGVFAIADFANNALAYTVGGPDAKLVYADRDSAPPSADPGAPGHDYGDYGVLHTIAFTLSNPTENLTNAYLYERPIGGIVRSSFLVDGAVIEVGCVREPVPYQIAAYALAPQSTYRVVVQTMTDGGSNYPLEVGISSVAPIPSAPPISSSEGCFPKPQPNPTPTVQPSPAVAPSPTPLV